jgi:hypothetical protein
VRKVRSLTFDYLNVGTMSMPCGGEVGRRSAEGDEEKAEDENRCRE